MEGERWIGLVSYHSQSEKYKAMSNGRVPVWKSPSPGLRVKLGRGRPAWHRWGPGLASEPPPKVSACNLVDLAQKPPCSRGAPSVWLHGIKDTQCSVTIATIPLFPSTAWKLKLCRHGAAAPHWSSCRCFKSREVTRRGFEYSST